MQIRRYSTVLKNGSTREGLILQHDKNLSEVAPLPNWSQETLADAFKQLKEGKCDSPSVRFGLASLNTPMPTHLDLPINAFEQYRPGFSVLKLKVGHLGLQDAIKLVQRHQQVPLRLDFNRKWPLNKLLRFASHFNASDFDYFEEPTEKLQDLIIFSNQTRFPIALDESAARFAHEPIATLKTIVVKPTLTGTIPTPPPGVELIFTFAYESTVGLLRIAQLAAQYNPTRPHGLDFESYLSSHTLFPPPIIENGRFIWNAP